MRSRIDFSNISVIYNEYFEFLYSYALHLGFDEHTTMDAIHDVFYKLCINHKLINEISNLKSYIVKSLRNRLIDNHRTNKEHLVLFFNQKNINENIHFHLNVSVEDELIEEEDAKEIRKKVENVLNKLTNRQREIIYLRFYNDFSYEEIAEIMQISVAASRNLMSRSLTKLKKSSLPILFFLF